jgi:ketosteroid isomerase-like protein
MTDSSADVVRELAAALNANDAERLVRVMDPEVVQYGTRGGIDQDRVLRGREAVLAYWDEIGEAWEWQTFEPERVIEGDDVVVALWRETVRIRDSDLDVESSTASLIKVRDGKVVELRGYMNRDEALRDAGMTAKSE